MEAYIKQIDYVLPEKILNNDELVKEFPEWTVDKIADKVGVRERRVSKAGETASDLAVKAAEKLFSQKHSIDRSKIDFLLLCTQSPDYFLPTSACVIQSRLGLSTQCGAFDFNLGCSGYIYGLAIAKGLIKSGIAKNVLLLTAETYTKYLHPKDKGNRTIFGDGATATIISTSGFGYIGEFELGTDGSGADNLIVRNGASRHPVKENEVIFDSNGNPISGDFLYMNGAEIFSFTQHKVPLCVEECIRKNRTTALDINLFIFHQANKYILNFLRMKMAISKEKFVLDMSETGNTVSNSIPMILTGLVKARKLSGEVLLCGFGVGYSWGAAIIKIVQDEFYTTLR